MNRIHLTGAFLAAFMLAACTGAAPKPVPSPITVPPPPPPPNSMADLHATPRAIQEPKIRVGMVSDQTTVTFPRTADGYLLVYSGTSIIKRGFTITSPVSDTAKRYAVQAGAISDERSAQAFVEKLKTASGQRVDSVFDPAGGLYKILVGDFADSASGQPLRDQLQQQGFGTNMQIVRRPTDQPFERVFKILDDEGDSYSIHSESMLVLPPTAETVTIAAKPYRGGARVFINPRGLFNVINELNLEDYLRGVVPAEMGSRIYDELEALKAQALAARTYAVRNLGQYGSEGFDICPGPACQAYNGFSGEEALTDQAVKETAGMVITYEGKMIDALYTATCGGHTSDVNTMFPGRQEPYLKAASCVELEMTELAGRADSGILSEPQMSARVFAALAGLPMEGSSWTARDVEAAVMAAGKRIGMPPSTIAPPASSRRGDVLVYLAHAASLDAAARTLLLPEDRKYFFPQSGDAELTPYLAASFLIKYGVIPTQGIDRVDLNAAMPREELYALLNSWMRKFQALNEATGKIVAINGRTLILKADGKRASFTLPDSIPVFRKLGERYREYRSVPVMLGDRAFVQIDGQKRVAAVVVQANFDGAAFDRTSSFSNWTRSYRADELVLSINKRNPIKQLLGIRPTVIDASNRVAEMEVTAEGGRVFTLKGLPVRWSLNIPDNVFVYTKSVDPDGMDRYTFFGKGWGHGIGMCQVGAYGMAFRGWTAEQIIKRYYTGVEIVPMK
jgi:stage II sporulation protein D